MKEETNKMEYVSFLVIQKWAISWDYGTFRPP